MSDYGFYEFKCTVNFQDDSEAIKEYFGPLLTCHNGFCLDAEIKYDRRKPACTEIILFSEPENRLSGLLQYLKSSGKNILSYLQICPTGTSGNKRGLLDFSNSILTGLYEDKKGLKAGKIPVIICLQNLTYYVSASPSDTSLFYLTENTCLWLDLYSGYRRDDEIVFSDRPLDNGTPEELFPWGEMAFGLRFVHALREKGKYDIHIVRLPQLIVKADAGKTDTEIINYARLICLLMSLYGGKFIDYYLGYVRITDGNAPPELNERIEFRFVKDQVDDTVRLPFGGTNRTFFDFIHSIDYEKVICSRKLLEDITDRVIRSQYIDSTSEFMLLYNVIEKIRNFYILKAKEAGQPFIIEEYAFTLSKTGTDKFIKRKLDEIAGIVQQQDKEAYLSKTYEKISVVRKTGLIDQFDSLILYTGLIPGDYKINFTELVKVRNRIYHGNFTETDLHPYIRAMRKLTVDLLLKTFSTGADARICTLSR